MKEEVWKPIKDYEGLYEISNLGRVKSLNYKRTGKEKILKNTENSKGYLIVCLTKNEKRKQFKIHRLVAEAFIPNPEDKPCIDHINTIKNDNRVENLRWVTNEENNNNPLTKKKRNENYANFKGENHPMYGRTGENHPMYGKHHSEETRKKMSKNHANFKGENHPFYGEHHTEETKRKMSEAKKGKYCGEKNHRSKSVVQIDPNTNEVVNIYFSTSEVTKQTGFNQSAISQCCNGKYSRLGNNIYKGFKWMYLEDYEKLNGKIN